MCTNTVSFYQYVTGPNYPMMSVPCLLFLWNEDSFAVTITFPSVISFSHWWSCWASCNQMYLSKRQTQILSRSYKGQNVRTSGLWKYGHSHELGTDTIVSCASASLRHWSQCTCVCPASYVCHQGQRGNGKNLRCSPAGRHNLLTS